MLTLMLSQLFVTSDSNKTHQAGESVGITMNLWDSMHISSQYGILTAVKKWTIHGDNINVVSLRHNMFSFLHEMEMVEWQ